MVVVLGLPSITNNTLTCVADTMYMYILPTRRYICSTQTTNQKIDVETTTYRHTYIELYIRCGEIVP